MELTVKNSFDIFNEITTRLYDIPFGNSLFQTKNFVIETQGTPERKYRAAALQLQDKLNNLKDASFKQRKDAVKIKKLQRDISNTTDELEIELFNIEIEEIQCNKQYTDKLVNDAIVEAQYLYDYIRSCPNYTREDFENGEQVHYYQKLSLEANGVTGALKSLVDMGVELKQIGVENDL